jgi:hypothetical protein
VLTMRFRRPWLAKINIALTNRDHESVRGLATGVGGNTRAPRLTVLSGREDWHVLQPSSIDGLAERG